MRVGFNCINSYAPIRNKNNRAEQNNAQQSFKAASIDKALPKCHPTLDSVAWLLRNDITVAAQQLLYRNGSDPVCVEFAKNITELLLKKDVSSFHPNDLLKHPSSGGLTTLQSMPLFIESIGRTAGVAKDGVFHGIAEINSTLLSKTTIFQNIVAKNDTNYVHIIQNGTGEPTVIFEKDVNGWLLSDMLTTITRNNEFKEYNPSSGINLSDRLPGTGDDDIWVRLRKALVLLSDITEYVAAKQNKA